MGNDSNKKSKKSEQASLSAKLNLLKLDINYCRSQGKYLYYLDQNKEIEVLDLINGYGALLFGHNHPDLVNCITKHFQSNFPNLVQMSQKTFAVKLADKIASLISNEKHTLYHSTITNSGAETVEVAIKHAALVKAKEIEKIKLQVSSALSEIKHIFHDKEITCDYEGKRSFNNFKELSNYVHLFNEQYLKSFLPIILIGEGSYHGKTLGALTLTSNSYYQTPIQILPRIKVVTYDENITAIESIIKREKIELLLPKINSKSEIKLEKLYISNILFLIIEPVRGEAGIRPYDINFLKSLSELLTNQKIPLVADEIQTGFFRCGYLSYLNNIGIYSDYLLLSKAMSGGIVKIGICAISDDSYIQEFSIMHTSTFAEDELSSHVALTSLELGIKNSNLILHLANLWLQKLKPLINQYPLVIKDIRSIGLMIGIEIIDLRNENSYAFQILSRSGYLGYLVCSYLLHVHHIRVSVTLSDPNTLRIHPNVLTEEKEMDEFISALSLAMEIIRSRDLYSLLNHLLPEDYRNSRQVQTFMAKSFPEDEGSFKSEVAFIVHYISTTSLIECEPSLAHLPVEIIEELLSKIELLQQPAILAKRIVRSSLGNATRVTFIGLPCSTEMIRKKMTSSRSSIEEHRKICNKAIDMCHDLGIYTVGLGQFNSIAMRNGKDVLSEKVLITSGNSLTVYAAYQAALQRLSSLTNDVTIAICGAGGNIALMLSELLLPHCKKMIIIGSSESSSIKIDQHVDYLKSLSCETILVSGWNLELLIDADIVLIATSAAEAYLDEKHFKKDSYVIDLSIPTNCKVSVKNSQGIKFLNGGLIKLPNKENLNITGIPLASGESYACLAETILMGLNNCQYSYSYGTIKKDDVFAIGEIARKHGFFVVE